MSSIEYVGQIEEIDNTLFETVERKGLGHPDTLADGAAERVAIAYTELCLRNFGGVLRHNFDKLYILGGLSEVDYGHSNVIIPANLYVGGHASTTFDGREFGAFETVATAASAHIRKMLPAMEEGALKTVLLTTDYDRRPYIHHPRSLMDVPENFDPRANDTSTTVGSWPVSRAETVALALEGYFYNHDGSPRFPDVGHDIKVMVRRNGNDYGITMAVPLLAKYMNSFSDYTDRIDELEWRLGDYAREIINNDSRIDLRVNTERPNGEAHLLGYGSCIEVTEEGFVGRGNKGRDIISNTRPMSMEAPHGKNAQSFSGKVHALMAQELARVLSEQHGGASVDVYISSNIGDPIKEPALVAVKASTVIDQSGLRKAMEEVRELNHLEMVLGGYFMPKLVPFSGVAPSPNAGQRAA